ncbi:MAG: hypothetical protein U9Q22_00945 [Candidatus Altiarchaeota archaeon]|nr:hypothetical protein [Candidatus Altiarchaeota archaeon]
MAKDLEGILQTGFLTWKTNLNLCLPFLLSSIIRILLVIPFLIILVMFLNPVSPGIFESSYYPTHKPLGTIINFLDYSLLTLDILLLLLFLLVLHLISSFFLAGAIGMSKRAVETGNTSLGDMMDFGGKKFIGLFLAQLIISLSIAVLFLFLVCIPVLIGLKVPSIGRGLIEFGVNLFSVLVLIICIVFAALPFAIVISDLGVIKGLKRGYGFFMDNKLSVILLWIFIRYMAEFIGYGVFFIAAVAFSLGILFVPIPSNISDISSFASESSLISLLIVFLAVVVILYLLLSWIASIFIVSPLTTVWWSRLYMDRTGSYGAHEEIIDLMKRKNDGIY